MTIAPIGAIGTSLIGSLPAPTTTPEKTGTPPSEMAVTPPTTESAKKETLEQFSMGVSGGIVRHPPTLAPTEKPKSEAPSETAPATPVKEPLKAQTDGVLTIGVEVQKRIIAQPTLLIEIRDMLQNPAVLEAKEAEFAIALSGLSNEERAVLYWGSTFIKMSFDELLSMFKHFPGLSERLEEATSLQSKACYVPHVAEVVARIKATYPQWLAVLVEKNEESKAPSSSPSVGPTPATAPSPVKDESKTPAG